MGAKQSKRSVDISGKEAESAGEVAAAGAGGEGRVEQLADADALKPQLNGDAHIHEKSEKELDSGTPENEKDATNEKEVNIVEEEKDNGPVVHTNGETEQKTDNGDSTLTPEEGKKPKKEKVKKKWSLRSISFSRKDKPKQEKKQKDEEPKINGEPEKVPEETAEATTPEVIVNDVSEEKTEIEDKEKTPETPVTQPITNGSSTPDSPKVEIEDSVKTSLDNDKPELEAEPEPEKLTVNGLSLEEHKIETPDVECKITESVENKFEEQAVEKAPEIAPTPEIPVKEVCVDQMPLIEPTPPPLPANPPPSSVVSFAATTMAPELTDASLPNTAENAIPVSPPTSALKSDEIHIDPTNVLTSNEIVTDNITTTKELIENNVVAMQIDKLEVSDNIPLVEATVDSESENTNFANEECANTDCGGQIIFNEFVVNPDDNQVVEPQVEHSYTDFDVVNIAPPIDEPCQIVDESSISPPDNLQKVDEDVILVKMPEVPVQEEGSEINSNHIISDRDTTEILNQEINVQPPAEKLDNTKDLIENISEVLECNGNIEENCDIGRTEKSTIETTSAAGTIVDTDKDSIVEEEEVPPAPLPQPAEAEVEPQVPAVTPLPPSPPSPMELPQEPVCEKMDDLIPEIPTVSELKTETLQETSTDVALAN